MASPTRNAHLSRRRFCFCCGAELAPAPAGARGRPRQYCDPETGRPCAQLVKTIASFRAQATAVLQNASGAQRGAALHALRGTLRILSQDLTAEAAELDGDHQRRTAVGAKDPTGFFGD